MKRRLFLGGAAAIVGAATMSACGGGGQSGDDPSASGGALTIKDVADRSVTLSAAPTKIILGESRQAFALLFLQRDNLLDKVVAWGTDLQNAAPDVYQRVASIQPRTGDIPTVGSVAKGDLSVENLLEHSPDLFLMTLDQYEAAKQAGFDAKLDAAKIPYLVTDFRRKPVENTHTSVLLLGQVFGAEDKAQEFLTYYDSLVNPVVEAAKAKPESERPLTFVWRSPGVSEPGRTFGDSNFGQIVTASGGNNLGSSLLDSDAGTVTTEQLIASQPQLIIATGGAWGKQDKNDKSATAYVDLGYNATPEAAAQSLAQLSGETGYSELTAFSEKQVYGIYHQFYDAPFNFLAYVAFARWQGLQVEGLPEVDAAWSDFHDKFMPFKAEGVFAAKMS
ncbi:MAG: ABC transporter substrate-binding protein [Propionibacteriaceae bacterium]|nr:ABC transporter substrate-binding protein [Propionibacteriaceae bacterium]